MLLRKYNKFEDIPDINSLINKIPIFATQEYADYLKETKNRDTIWFVCFEKDTISYIFPFSINKKLIFKRGYLLTEVISLDPGNSLEKEKIFLDEVITYIKKHRICDWIHQGPNWALFKTYPTGAISVKYGTYKIFLKDKDEAKIFNLIDRKCRQDINKSIRSGVKIVNGISYLNDCLTIINQTAQEANLHILTLTEVNKLILRFGKSLMIYVAYYNDMPQSAEIFIYNEFCVYALYAGSIKNPFRGATAYLYWEAIRDAKKNNCEYFDFVGARINPIPGSKVERIQKFKEQFGSELSKGYLWKMIISKSNFKIYNNLIKFYFLIFNKNMKKDIIDQELEKLKREAINTDN